MAFSILNVHTGRLGKPNEQLVMNVCDDYRWIQEERHAIDRCIPGLESGKVGWTLQPYTNDECYWTQTLNIYLLQGYRVGSEFWSMPERIGNELSGLTITLTQRERGYPSPITHIGKTSSIKQETGMTQILP